MINHCKNCHQEVFNIERHQASCIPSNLRCFKCNPDPIELQDLKAQIQKKSQEEGRLEKVEGVFGDSVKNIGFVESYNVTKNGIETKFFGCSIPYPGKIDSKMIDSVATVKRVLMATVGTVLKNWYFFSPLILIFWKTTIKAFVYWFAQIYEVDLKGKALTALDDFSPTTSEMIRAGLKLADNIHLKNAEMIPFYLRRKEFECTDGQEYRIRVRRCMWCIGTFIQADSAYYWRVQDPLSNLNKDNLRVNIRKEILRLFDLAISREKQIPDKIVQLRKLASILLLFPPIRKLAFEYFNELHVTQFQSDDNNRYWAYRRSCYDFEGKSFEERLQWAKNLDKERNHVILSE